MPQEVGKAFLLTPSLLAPSLLLSLLLQRLTLLTNALTGGHMGIYLGLFNGTICVPQIVAAALGGSILRLLTPAGGLAPEVDMLVLAGIFLIVGAACVLFIKEHPKETTK